MKTARSWTRKVLVAAALCGLAARAGIPQQTTTPTGAGTVNSKDPFGTKQEALDYYTDNKAANPKWKAPAGLASAVKNTVAAAVNSANPLGALFQAAIWIRVAEVAAGLILLGIGLNAMLKGRPLSAVTSAAGAAGKVAMF